MITSYSIEKNGVIDTPFFSLPFEIDQNFHWLKVEVNFSKKGWYSILVWDSNQTLRNQSLYINEPKTVLISMNPEYSSFGSVSGLVQKGEWILEILCSTYKAKPEFQINIKSGNHIMLDTQENGTNWSTSTLSGGFELNLYDFKREIPKPKTWFKGDFHTHTNESDGKMTPEMGMEQAKKMGLDFFVATDHNIVPTKWLADDEMLVIPGVEITSSKGHFNALGLPKWIDWRPTCPDGGMETEEGMNRIIQEVKATGAIFSINHPMLKPWEWQFKNTKLADIDTIEIWNDPTYKDNPLATEAALILWNTLWEDGHRIYGIGGSDSHLLPTDSYEKNGPPSVIGDPATYVNADTLSAEAILDGVKKGKVYVSRGPVLDMLILVNGEKVSLGSNLSESSCLHDGASIEYEVTYQDVPEGSTLNWIQNGKVLSKKSLNVSGKIKNEFAWSKEEVNWLRFEIRCKDGKLLSFANPIFQGEKEKKLHTWNQLLEASGFADFLDK